MPFMIFELTMASHPSTLISEDRVKWSRKEAISCAINTGQV